MSINEENFPYELVKAFPEFMVKYLQHAEAAANDPEDPFILSFEYIVDFRRFAIKVFAQGKVENVLQGEMQALFQRIVGFIELLLSSSDEFLVAVAGSGFLENLKKHNPHFHEMAQAFGPKAVKLLRLMYPDDDI
jgi:hypothetical protein